jgi:hypothetical protein
MRSTEKKFLNFIGDLKASNIASNITSLMFYSDQIRLLLDQITVSNDNPVVENNLKESKDVINKTKDSISVGSTLTDNYIKFGDIFKSMLLDLKETNNLKYLQRIAIHYLDIAKLTKDERIKNLAFVISDELSE